MAEGKISLSDTREQLHCSMRNGNASGPGFREGFCEVMSLLRPGWGVGIGQANSRVKGAPGIGPSMDKGLEMKMSKQNPSQKPRQRGFSRQGGKEGAGGARSCITWSLTKGIRPRGAVRHCWAVMGAQ